MFLKEITSPEDNIAFRDNVPVGYLYANGKICDIRTWDCMQYTYGQNDPSALYKYYDRYGNIPDKIIYVDFGRDEKLSIYDEDYLYNRFVNYNYFKALDTKLNEKYKEIIVFKKKK